MREELLKRKYKESRGERKKWTSGMSMHEYVPCHYTKYLHYLSQATHLP